MLLRVLVYEISLYGADVVAAFSAYCEHQKSVMETQEHQKSVMETQERDAR